MSDSEAKQHVSASGRIGVGDAPINPADVVAPGQVLAGKFRVERMLGAGGMGVVVEARDVDLDDRVAIKLLLPSALEQPDIVARFRREARAAVKIKSEHIARVIDVGSLDDGAPFIVMEYLEGYDLSKPIRKHGRLNIPVAVDYMLQAAEAIAEAHTLGIVHRDIKPPNIFLTLRADGSPCIKVLDFGISKVIGGLDSGEGDAPEATLTQTSVVLGSPRYMAPEQISKPKSVDARADIWGIGTTFYRLVTGYAPFEGSTLPEIFAAILMTPDGPPPIHQHLPGAPVELDAVIRRCIRINPAERWPNIGDLATALAPFGTPAAKESANRIRGILDSAGIYASMPPVSASGVSAFTLASPASTSGASMANTLETSVAENIGIPKRSPVVYVIGAMTFAVLLTITLVLLTKESTPATNATNATAPTASTAVVALSSTVLPAVVSVAEIAPPAPATPSASATSMPATPTPIAPRQTAVPAKPKPKPGEGEGNGDELFDQRN